MKNLTVAFRVDASVEIGMGHAMRCLTLADELRVNGVSSVFIMRSYVKGTLEKIKSHGHRVDILPAASQEYIAAAGDAPHAMWLGVSWARDIQDTVAVLSELKPDWLIIDHYGIDYRWHEKARVFVKNIMVIDDLADRNLDCDILLDQTCGRTDGDYRPLVPDSCRMLVGSRYAILRPQFQAHRQLAIKRRMGNDQVHSLLVSMGGTDPENMTELVLDAISTVNWTDPPDVEVILGTNAPHLHQVKEKLKGFPLRAKLSVSVDDMAERMTSSDLAIGTGGVTSWERCSLGLPAIVIVIAENQRVLADNLEKAGVAFILPDMKTVTSNIVREKIEKLLRAPGRLREMSAACFSIVDAFGAGRVASELMRSADSMKYVTLRPVTNEDADRIFQWQCDPRTRRFFHNKDVPTYEEHLHWLQKRIEDTGSLTEMIVSDKAPAGVVRLDPVKEQASLRMSYMVSIYIAPKRHGSGLGTAALKQVCVWMIHADLYAEINPENIASINLFTRCGFRTIGNNKYFRAALT